MSEQSYVEGFQQKCAEYGVDPQALVKLAQQAEQQPAQQQQPSRSSATSSADMDKHRAIRKDNMKARASTAGQQAYQQSQNPATQYGRKDLGRDVALAATAGPAAMWASKSSRPPVDWKQMGRKALAGAGGVASMGRGGLAGQGLRSLWGKVDPAYGVKQMASGGGGRSPFQYGLAGMAGRAGTAAGQASVPQTAQ